MRYCGRADTVIAVRAETVKRRAPGALYWPALAVIEMRETESPLQSLTRAVGINVVEYRMGFEGVKIGSL